MNDRLREAQYLGIVHLREIDWYFRVYLMRGDVNEEVNRGFLFDNLREKIRVIAAEYLSSEFKYLRSGFAIAHYGRRGVTYSFWHWADWQGTWEYFCQAWYCYGRAIDGMTPLDRTEPIVCQHEINVVMHEALIFREIAFRSSTHEALISDYRNNLPE